MSETSVSIDGVRSPVLEFGPAEAAEAVVFVHGNPVSTHDWEGLAHEVGEFGRALAMDVPFDLPRGKLRGQDAMAT
jgi:pimeloyl-ACP methyl ester carboxylesterase